MHPFCSSSPDGVFALMKKNTQGTYDFIGICVIEIKTRASENTVDALTESVLRGGLFTECVTGTELFERVIPDNAYRTQICQHATALGVDNVLMVYSLPGANVKKLVLVGVSVEHRYELLKFQTLLATKYMPFCYVENHSKDIPSLGTDYSKAYGYAQDHHTLELYLYLWHAHNKDVVENGTPPPCRRLIDITFSYWNKMMGNVDIMRKVLEKRKAVRGPDSSPGSLMWFSLLGYTIYNAFRLYQHAQLERKLTDYKTFKQFQKARQLMTYTSFLFKLGVGPNYLCERAMVQYYPGLKKHLNHSHCLQETAAGVGGARPDVDSTETTTGYKCHAYNMIEAFLRTDSEKYHLHLDATKPHKSVSLSKEDKRGRCLLCCEFCNQNKCKAASESNTTNATKKFSRMGRKSRKYCITCRVILCKYCHTIFHKPGPISLPACSQFLDLATGPATRSDTPATEREYLTTSRTRSTPLSAGITQTTQTTPTSAGPTGSRNRARTSGAMSEDRTSPAQSSAGSAVMTTRAWTRAAERVNISSSAQQPRQKKARRTRDPNSLPYDRITRSHRRK